MTPVAGIVNRKFPGAAESVEVLSLTFQPRQVVEFLRVLMCLSLLERCFFLSTDLIETLILPLLLPPLTTIRI